CCYLGVGYSFSWLFLSCLSGALGGASNIHTRTQHAGKMACTLHTQAVGKMACTLHTQTVGKMAYTLHTQAVGKMAYTLHTQAVGKMADTLHTQAVGKTAYTPHRQTSGKMAYTQPVGRTLGHTRKHKRVDNTDTLGDRLRTHRPGEMACSTDGDTWHNRRHR